MIKVLRVIHSLNPKVGGPPEGIIQVSPILRKYGVETTVICLDNPKSKWLNNKPFKVIPLGKGFLNYGFQFGLVSKIANIASNYDLVIIHGLWQYHSLSTFLALRKLNRKYFVFTHGMLDPWFKKKYPLKHLKKKLYWNLVESKIIRGSEAVFFTSKKEEIVSRSWFKNLKAKKDIINYGIAKPPQKGEKLKKFFYQKFPILKDKKVILFLSRIDNKKGVDLLIEAFGEIHKNYPKLCLVIAGPYSKSNKLFLKLKKIIKKYNIKNKVLFTGMIEGDLKWGAYYASDFYCLPSHSENFGIVVAEALGCGRLVGISNKVNIYEDIANAKAGLIFNDTKEDTVNVLKKWIKLNKGDKIKMRKNARLLFEKKYNSINNAYKFVDKLKYYFGEKFN